MLLLSYEDLTQQSDVIIEAVSSLFGEYLSEDIVKLESQVREIEAYYANIQYLLPQAENHYRVNQERVLDEVLGEKEKKPNEFDKKIYVDSRVSEYKLLRDTLKNLGESIRQRISLGQSILKNSSENRSYNE